MKQLVYWSDLNGFGMDHHSERGLVDYCQHVAALAPDVAVRGVVLEYQGIHSRPLFTIVRQLWPPHYKAR